MAKKLLLLVCLVSSFSLFCQESIRLNGQLVADSLDTTSVNIINLTQKTGTVNTPSGTFEIKVFQDDTLIFSSVQFQLEEVVISQNIFEAGNLEVVLTEKINQLEEVNISDLDLTGNLATDLADIPVYKQSDFGFSLPNTPKLTQVERRLYTASSAPLDLLLNTLNGRIKMLKKVKANDELERLVQKGIDALPFSVFIEEFGIPEDHVENFVYFCAEDKDFKGLMNSDKPLELLEWYRSKVAYYLEHRMGL